ncbi:serpin family protein [Patescibacteria group bacterium]|nr:serpin family protein [Patescibacteria group bacterium]
MTPKLKITIGMITLLAAVITGIFWYGNFTEPEIPSEPFLPPVIVEPEIPSEPVSPPAISPETSASESEIAAVVDASNQFAFDLYSEYKAEGGNVFFSPYSISTALAMTFEGARGQTAEEMQTVFHFPENEDERKLGYSGLLGKINAENENYKLSTANALWAQENYKFLDEYFETVEKYYGGGVTNLDFAKETESSRITINNWVEDQTNDKIKDLIPVGGITGSTKLVLTNAIYFKGDWLKQFNEDETRDDDFRMSSGETIEVPMMQQTDEEAKFNFAENEELQILELPYSGEELSMLILLPKNDDLDLLENNLTLANLAAWKKDLRKEQVKVFIPKFKFETKYFMAKDLAEMGMPTAFSGAADFSGMTGERDLFISAVIHQAFVEVNEEGTEAAAATAVVMDEEMVAEPESIPIFRADHPFVFLIQEKETGSILFLGRVSDPS